MPSFIYEQKFSGYVVGLDEAGCGPWAGPVVAASFCFKSYAIAHDILKVVKDSKQLSIKKRSSIYNVLVQNPDNLWHYGIGLATVQEIDCLNIRQATLLAMQRAYADMSYKVEAALVDGTVKPVLDIPIHSIIKGDSLSYSVAAASIIAKVFRDKLMMDLSQIHPGYGWETNAGYGTLMHRNALKKLGVTPHHRKTYRPIQFFLQT